MKKLIAIISIVALVFLGLSSGAFCAQGGHSGGGRSGGGGYHGGGHSGGGYYGGGRSEGATMEEATQAEAITEEDITGGRGYYGRGGYYYRGGGPRVFIGGYFGSPTIIRTVTLITTLTGMRIPLTPIRIRNLKRILTRGNPLTGITVGIQKVITRT